MNKHTILVLLMLMMLFCINSTPTGGLGADPCPNTLFSDLVTPLGYPFAAYSHNTDDGYLLRIFRIQGKNNKMADGKPVVFLQHGLFDSADSWVVNTEENSLGLVLANLGYDVWVGNSRGNKYSRNNQFVDQKDKKFWDYSFQEMGRYDVPANIKFILEKTGAKKIIYVGHSQGTSQMFAALSDPDVSAYVNSKVSKFIALAPIVYMAFQESVLIRTASSNKLLVDASHLFQGYEWVPGKCSQSALQFKFETFVCNTVPLFCNPAISISDRDGTYNNQQRMPLFLQHYPSGTSLRTLLHYAQSSLQNKASPKFIRYDFGNTENTKRYGRPTPPEYDLSLIRIPVRSFAGLQDKLSDPEDNKRLTSSLSALGKDYRHYNYNDWGHTTFLWGKDSRLVFKDILSEISK